MPSRKEKFTFPRSRIADLDWKQLQRVQALTVLVFFLITQTVYAYYKKIKRAENSVAWKLTTLMVFSLPTDFCEYPPDFHVCCNSYYSYNHY